VRRNEKGKNDDASQNVGMDEDEERKPTPTQ